MKKKSQCTQMGWDGTFCGNKPTQVNSTDGDNVISSNPAPSPNNYTQMNDPGENAGYNGQ